MASRSRGWVSCLGCSIMLVGVGGFIGFLVHPGAALVVLAAAIGLWFMVQTFRIGLPMVFHGGAVENEVDEVWVVECECGCENDEDAKFCTLCGSHLDVRNLRRE